MRHLFQPATRTPDAPVRGIRDAARLWGVRLSRMMTATTAGLLGVAALTSAAPVQAQSLSGLNSPVSAPTGTTDGSFNAIPPGNYRAAHDWAMRQRTYPTGSIDPQAYARAVAHRDAMAAANNIGNRKGSTLKAHSIGGQLPGSGWSFIGPVNYGDMDPLYFGTGNVTGRVNAVAYDPKNPTTLYIGSASGGLWKSTNDGASWTTLSDFVPTDGKASDPWTTLEVSSIAIDPTNSQIIYAGTGDYPGLAPYSIGIMKSVDGGVHWSNVTRNPDGSDLFGGAAVSKIQVDPENPKIVTAATGRGSSGVGYLWRSAQGGAPGSWFPTVDRTGGNLPQSEWSDVEIGPKAANGVRYYYANANFANVTGNFGGLWRSSDRGVTWAKIFAPYTNAQFGDQSFTACSPTDPNTVYEVAAVYNFTVGTPKDKIYKSVNAGSNSPNGASVTWQDITGGPLLDTAGRTWSQGFYDLHFSCGSSTVSGQVVDTLYLGLLDIFRYTQPEGWQTITQVNTTSALTHTDQHAFAFNPSNPNDFLAGNDGGVYHLDYDPAKKQWSSKSLNSAPLGITQLYGISVDSSNPSSVIGGAQDNGSFSYRSIGGVPGWHFATGGDGGYALIDPFRPNNQYSSSQSLNIFHSTDFWKSSPVPPNSAPGSYGTYYIGPGTGTDNTAFIAPLSMDPIHTNFVYGGTDFIDRYDDTTGVWTTHLSAQRLVNHGTTPSPKDGYYVQTIAVAPSDSTMIYTGSNDGEVWFSPNTGNLYQPSNTSSWTEVDAGLPNQSITSLSVNPNNPADVIVGFSGFGASHVYQSLNSGGSWQPIGGDPNDQNSLPNIPVNAVVRDPYDPINTFYVGTDIGLFQTTDNGATWTNATVPLGLPNVQVNDLKAQPGIGYLYAGTFGRGIWRIALNDTTGAGGTAFVGVQSVVLTPSPVVGGSNVNGVVTLTGPAPAGGAKVTLASGNPALTLTTTTLTIPAGQVSATFTATTVIVPVQTDVKVAATYNTTTKSGTVRLLPIALGSVSIAPNPIGGGAVGTGTVTLTNPAPTSGVTIQLTSDTPGALTVPATAFIPAGATSVPFTVNTSIVAIDTKVVVTAAFNGTTKTASVTVLAPKLVSVSIVPTSIPATLGATGTVTLTGPAPKSGIVVTLSSDTPKVLQVPASVTVPSGQTTATFPVTTSFVNADTAVTVSAVFNGVTATTTVTVVTPKLSSFVVNPITVLAGNSVTATVTLTGPAGPGGYRVNLSDDGFVNTGGFGGQNYFVHVPNSFGFFGQGRGYVIVPAGQTSVTFTITTSFVRTQTNVTITAQDATVTLNANLSVQAPLKSLTIAPTSIKGGYSVTGTIVFNVPDFFYPSDTVIVTSSNTNVATVVTTMPNRVTMLGGATVTKFSIATRKVTSTQTVTITANFGGTIITQNLTVTP